MIECSYLVSHLKKKNFKLAYSVIFGSHKCAEIFYLAPSARDVVKRFYTLATPIKSAKTDKKIIQKLSTNNLFDYLFDELLEKNKIALRQMIVGLKHCPFLEAVG